MHRAAATVALGAALTLAAAAFASASLYVPGLALLLLVATATLWVALAGRRAALERVAGPRRVEEGHPWRFEISARSGLLPAPGGELLEPLLGGGLAMAGRRRRRVRASVTFERRGLHRLAPVELAIADPLGLARHGIEAGAGQEVLVLPRVEPVRAADRQAGHGAASGPQGGEVGAQVEMDSLRPYRPGAPAARIHWPTVARAGVLMERRLAAEGDSLPLVVLDPAGPAEGLDAAVRAAASLCVHLARAGGCALLLPGDRRPTELKPDLAGWPLLHARLALVGRGSDAARMPATARPSALFWVTGSAGPGRPRLLERAHGAGWLVAPGRAEGHAFTVAGCAGVRIGRGRVAA